MRAIFLFFVILVTSTFSFAQQSIRIEYKHIRSQIATLKENLYTDGVNVISIQDKKVLRYYDTETPQVVERKPFHFISRLEKTDKRTKDFFCTAFIGDDGYFIHDEVPAMNWKIDTTSTKKIKGYNCIKATTTFRGRNYTAFYTPDIPYAIGPSKFFGLPGAILDIREDGSTHNIWAVDNIDLNYGDKIDYHPTFSNYTKVNMRRFVELQDEDRERFSKSIPVPSGSISESIKERLTMERLFEWEGQ